MRTTLSLDDDVAAAIEERLKKGETSLKQLVNDALRAGLNLLSSPPKKRKPYHTKQAHLGKCLVGSIDDVAEVLAVAEGENFS